MGGISTQNVRRGGLALDRISGVYQRNPWGRTLYVSSAHPRATDTGVDGRDPYHPLKTLARALALAQSGDTIIVGIGHTETVSTANGLNIPSTKTDIEIMGIGSGQRRPRFTFTTLTTADFMISGAGTKVDNLRFFSGVASQVAMLTVDAPNCELLDLAIEQDSTNQVIDAIKLSANCNQTTIRGLFARQTDAGAASCVQVIGGANLLIEDSDIAGDYSVGCVNNATTAFSRCNIRRNFMHNLNAADPCIVLQAAATGWIADNRFRNTQADAADLVITAGTAVQLAENYVVNADRETGKLVGTASG